MTDLERVDDGFGESWGRIWRELGTDLERVGDGGRNSQERIWQ